MKKLFTIYLIISSPLLFAGEESAVDVAKRVIAEPSYPSIFEPLSGLPSPTNNVAFRG